VSPAPRNDSSAADAPRDLPLARAARWIRDQLQAAQDARALPPVRKPPVEHLAPPRRGWLAGWWSARIAAGSGVRVEEFLRHRLARYLAALPVPPERLPVAISIEDGGDVVVAPQAGADRARPPWLDGYLRTYGGPSVQPEVLQIQAELARLYTKIQEQRAKVEVAQREADVAAAEPAIAELDGAGGEPLGRPPVPLPWTAAIQLFGFVLLLAQAWQLALPVLGASGIDTTALTAELVRDPAGVVLGGAFAVGAAVSLFLFADLAVRQAAELFAMLGGRARALWAAVAGLGALGFAAAVSWSIAGLRPGAPSAVDVQYARFTLFLLALALPITTSCLLRLGRRLQARRAEALAAALAWDRAHHRAVSGWSRRAFALAHEERELARFEEDRASALRRLRVLRQRTQLVERRAAEAAEREAQELDRLWHAVSSALELDRYEFLRQAGARGAVLARPQAARREGERSLGLAG
jgi:hypothetical protein